MSSPITNTGFSVVSSLLHTALTKGQFVDGQLLLLAVTLRLPSLVFHITATPVAGSESFSIEVRFIHKYRLVDQ